MVKPNLLQTSFQTSPILVGDKETVAVSSC